MKNRIWKMVVGFLLLSLVGVALVQAACPVTAENWHENNILDDIHPLSTVAFSDDFSSDPNSSGRWTIHRFSDDANNEGSWDASQQTVYLVRAVNSKAVAMFANYDLVATKWQASFRYRVGGGSGADGFVFMFYKDKQAYDQPEAGSWLGFELAGNPRIPVAGYGIEFDNYHRIGSDPSSNHIALIKDRHDNHLIYTNDGRTEDNIWHDVVVVFESGALEVLVDEERVISYNLSTPDYTYTGIGFGGATGGFTNNHIIDDFVLTVSGGGPGPILHLPFNPSGQNGLCASSPNSLSCISSLFDHEYPLLPTSLGGTEPTEPEIGHKIMIFNGDKWSCGGMFPNASDYGYSGHDAVDFALFFDSPLVPAAPGTVTVIPNHPWGGLVLEIDHGNGYKSAYWHLSRVADGIYSGTQITQADVESRRVIGYSGTAGTGAHLHFAVYLNGKQIDPFGWEGGFEDPWVADYGGAASNCLWNFACSVPTWATSTSDTSLTSPDGSMTVLVPAGAVTDMTLFELTLAPNPVAQSSAIPAGYSFDLSAQDIHGNAVENFLQPLTIVINYAESIVDYLVENTLTLYYWNGAAQSWQPLATDVDLENNTTTVTTDHLSLFALLGEPQNPAPTIISVSPNSGYRNLDTEIAIDGTGFLPTPSVRLGTGELVVTFVDSATLAAVVPSGLDPGVYTLTVTNPDAQEDSLESAFTVLPVQEEPDIYLPIILKSSH